MCFDQGVRTRAKRFGAYRESQGRARPLSGLLSNQGEKSINLYFIRVPLRKKVLKYGTPKPRGRARPLYQLVLTLTPGTFFVAIARLQTSPIHCKHLQEAQSKPRLIPDRGD